MPDGTKPVFLVKDRRRYARARQDRRRHPRSLVDWSGVLRDDRGAVKFDVLDVSAGGARLRTDRELRANSKVMLDIHRVGGFLGEVVWQYPDGAGIRFLEDPRDVSYAIISQDV